MIPAILSVVFVIYLYQSLKETHVSPGDRTTCDSSGMQTAELVARLKSLQTRVDQLASSHQNKGDA
jgi:hypothetical protein